jgi:urease accessory protein
MWHRDRCFCRLRAAITLSLIALLPSQAMAHPSIVTPNAFAGGLLHSFGGLDHALAMIGVGVLSTRLLRADILLLPLTFLFFLAVGASLGHLGIERRATEAAVAISCLALGSCILSPRLQSYRRSIFAVVAAFATAHGYAHSIELPAGFSASQFTLGFLSASAFMHLTGVFLGDAFKDEEHRWLMHVFGAAMVVFGVLFSMRSFRDAPSATSESSATFCDLPCADPGASRSRKSKS